MSQSTREDLELYVMGGYEGDIEKLEAHLAEDAEARAYVAEQAQLEMQLREVAEAATFCPACDDVVRDVRCDSCGAAVSAGGFEIEQVLVQNAHGRLYLAHDADGRRVALKELAFVQSPGAEAIAAFEREAQFLRALEHPAIPRFVASFEEGSGVHARFYLAQEYIDGQPLDRMLGDHWFDETEIRDIARQVLEILVYLQKLSPMIVHRDVKPANMVRRDDGSIALVDFGAAYDQGETLGSTLIGTFGYMPVEQMAGVVDATTDTYSLGASLLHLLTRREPWKILEAPALGSANVSPPLRELLHKLVGRNQEDRYPSAAAALAALEQLDDEPPARAAIVAAAEREPRRWWPVAIAAAAFSVGAIGATGIAMVGDDSERAVETVMPPAPPEIHFVNPPDIDFAPTPAVAPPGDPLPAGEAIDMDFKEASIHDVLRFLAEMGKVNIVIPDEIRAQVTVQLEELPWDQALEVILESERLWYTYRADANIIRIAARKRLDSEEMAALERRELVQRLAIVQDEPLPRGRAIDLDFKDADIHNLLRLIADVGGVNIVVPDEIRAKVTVRLRDVPWDQALEVILESKGLWYKYRSKGKVLRIASRKRLDSETMAEAERNELRSRTAP